MIVCKVEKEEYEILEGLAPEEDVNAFYEDEDISAFVLIDGDDVVGTLIGTIVNEAYQVYWLYVEPEYRRQGGGKLLISTLKKILSYVNVPIHIAWEGEPEISKEICLFLLNQGFTKEREKEIRSYSVHISDIDPTEKMKKRSDKVVSFESLGKEFLRNMEKDKDANKSRMVPEGGFLAKDIRKDLSLAYLKGEEPIAYVVLKEDNDNVLQLNTMYSSGEANTVITYLLYELAYLLKDKCDGNQLMHINAVTDGVDALIKYFIPTAEEIGYSYYG